MLASTEAIDDPALHEYVAELDGVIAAKAWMVTRCHTVAYVSDMYTQPGFRRKGLGSVLLAHLHARAAETGKECMILVPSLMTLQIGFYEKHGYREAVPIQVLIPGI